MEEIAKQMIWKALHHANDDLPLKDYQVIESGVNLLTQYIIHHVQNDFFFNHLDLYQEYFNALASSDETTIKKVINKIKQLTQQPIFA